MNWCDLMKIPGDLMWCHWFGQGSSKFFKHHFWRRMNLTIPSSQLIAGSQKYFCFDALLGTQGKDKESWCARWNRQSMTINKKTGWMARRQTSRTTPYKQVEELSHLSFLPFFRTARNHHLQTKQQTKPWDKMMQHVTSCLKRSKQIHYCKW